MARKKYLVELSDEERAELKALISAGQESTRKLTRARILLKADEGWTDPKISDALDCSPATVQRTRHRFAEEGLAAIHRRKPNRIYERKLDGAA
ncbi:Homeodomain-like domain-containing protein, partial [Halogranum amylolyticum]